MENVKLSQVNFTAGELAPTLLGREDIQQYALGAEKMRNVLVVPHGGFKRAPGLRFDAELQRSQFDVFTASGSGTGQTYDFVANGTVFSTGAFPTGPDVFCIRERVGFGTEYLGRHILTSGSSGDLFFSISGDELTFHGNLEPGDKIYLVSNLAVTLGSPPNETFTLSYTEDLADDGGDGIALVPFSFSVNQQYLVVFTNFMFSVYKKVGQVFTLQRRLASPYFGSDIALLTHAQSLDSLVSFEKFTAPLRFVRQGTDTDWRRSFWPHAHSPKYEFGDIYSPDGDHSTAPASVAQNQVERIKFVNFVTGDECTIFVDGEESPRFEYGEKVLDGSGQAVAVGGWIMNPRRLQDEAGDEVVVLEDDVVDNLQAALDAMDNVGSGNSVVAFTGESGEGDQQAYTITLQGDAAGKSLDFQPGNEAFSNSANIITFITDTRGKGEEESIWSERRGWPRCGTFFGGRFYWCGAYSLPHWVVASRPTNQQDFNTKLSLADYGIAYPLDSNDVSSIFGVYAGKHLTFLTGGAEFYAPSTLDSVPTPESFFARKTTSRGAKEGLPVFDVQGGLVFVERHGKSLQEVVYEEDSQSYNATSLSTLAPHLIDDPVDMAFRSSTTVEEADYIYVCNSNGSMAIFNTLRAERVNAWTLRTTAGDFKSVAIVDSDTLVAVRRTIDGADRYFLEHFDADLYMDCATDGLGGDSDTTALGHLTNESCDLLIDGTLDAQVTAASTTTFGRTSGTAWQAGLPFPDVSEDGSGYQTWVKLLPAQLGAENQSLRGHRQGVSRVHARLYNTSSLGVRLDSGTNYEVPFRSFGDIINQSIPVYTGMKELVQGMTGWSDGAQLSIFQTKSLPMYVLSITQEVSL